MIRRLVASGGILVALACCQGTVSADEINVQWLAGKWKGTTPSSSNISRPDEFSIAVKEDGTFEGDYRSSLGGGISLRQGRFKIEGETVILECVVESGPTHGKSTSFALTRKGDILEGTNYRSWNGRTFPASLQRDK